MVRIHLRDSIPVSLRSLDFRKVDDSRNPIPPVPPVLDSPSVGTGFRVWEQMFIVKMDLTSRFPCSPQRCHASTSDCHGERPRPMIGNLKWIHRQLGFRHKKAAIRVSQTVQRLRPLDRHGGRLGISKPPPGNP